MFNYTIHHALALVPPLADDLCHPTKPQKMCVSFSRLEGTPRLLQTLNGWIQTGTFFFLPLLIEKARTQVTGQGLRGDGGRPGCQGGVHRRGKANGAHWTVQTGLRAARIITIAQAAIHSQPRWSQESRRDGTGFCYCDGVLSRSDRNASFYTGSSYDGG